MSNIAMEEEITILTDDLSIDSIQFSPEYFTFENQNQREQYVAALSLHKKISFSGINALDDMFYILKHCNCITELNWTITKISEEELIQLSECLISYRNKELKLNIILPELLICPEIRIKLIDSMLNNQTGRNRLQIGSYQFRPDFLSYLQKLQSSPEDPSCFIQSSEIADFTNVLAFKDIKNIGKITIHAKDIPSLLAGFSKAKSLERMWLCLENETRETMEGLAAYIRANRGLRSFYLGDCSNKEGFSLLVDAFRVNTSLFFASIDNEIDREIIDKLTVRNTNIHKLYENEREDVAKCQSEDYYQKIRNKLLNKEIKCNMSFPASSWVVDEIRKLLPSAFQASVIEASEILFELKLVLDLGEEHHKISFIKHCLQLNPYTLSELPKDFYMQLMMHAFGIGNYSLALNIFFKLTNEKKDELRNLFYYSLNLYLTGQGFPHDNVSAIINQLPNINDIKEFSETEKVTFIERLMGLQKIILQIKNDVVNESDFYLNFVQNYLNSFEEDYSLSFLEKILGQFSHTNSTGIKAMQKTLNSALSYEEKISQIKSIALQKIQPGLSYRYSHSNFFGKGRDSKVEAIYIYLSALPVLAKSSHHKSSELLEIVSDSFVCN